MSLSFSNFLTVAPRLDTSLVSLSAELGGFSEREEAAEPSHCWLGGAGARQGLKQLKWKISYLPRGTVGILRSSGLCLPWESPSML